LVRGGWWTLYRQGGDLDNLLDDFLFYLIILISAIYVKFMTISDYLTIIWIILVAIGVIFTILKYIDGKRVREKPKIKEIIDDFIDEAIDNLTNDKFNVEEFKLPDSLFYYFGISIDTETFRKFSKKRQIITWGIERYNKYCGIINDKIKRLKKKTIEEGLFEPVNYIVRDVIRKSEYDDLLEWTKKYEDLNQNDKDKVIEEHNLKDYIDDIKELKKKLPNKIEKLLKKLKKLKMKWEDIYL
jgi:hypothetical protein